MEEIGYVSCAGGKDASATILEAQYDKEAWPTTVDATYFFGNEPIEVSGELLDPHALHLNPVYYADKSIIDRCALMHDAGEAQELLLEMWNKIKLAR
jgi:spermidine/putrescine transport system substrate-binding protein